MRSTHQLLNYIPQNPPESYPQAPRPHVVGSLGPRAGIREVDSEGYAMQLTSCRFNTFINLYKAMQDFYNSQ